MQIFTSNNDDDDNSNDDNADDDDDDVVEINQHLALKYLARKVTLF